MNLYLCEKPSQAKDIAVQLGASTRKDGYFEGNGTQVTWCFGHLLETAPPEYYCDNLKPWRMDVLPVIPKQWHMDIKKDKDARSKKQFNCIKALLKKARHVTIATDADREGEVIAREVLEQCNYQGRLDRLWLAALDPHSIQKALNNKKTAESTESLYHAGLARQRADWLMGMNLTMAVSHLFGEYGEGVLSVGRVQTPTLALVVNRDRTIDNFTPNDFWQLQGVFTQGDEVCTARWQPKEEVVDAQGYVTDRAFIEQIKTTCQGQSATVTQRVTQTKHLSPPVCLSLSSLQQKASSAWGLSAKTTLDVAQSLYEKYKATTYPRTDTGYLPEAQHCDAPVILDALKTNLPALAPLIEKSDTALTSPVWNDKKITAHHGIIPTLNKTVDTNSMSENEKNMYTLIARHYLAQFFKNHTYDRTELTLTCDGETFKAHSKTPKVTGWHAVLGNEKAEVADTEDDNALKTVVPDSFTKGTSLEITELTALAKKTKAPAYFTEGSLIAAMKNIAKTVNDAAHKTLLNSSAGIGTEATRANILETLVQRGFLVRHKKQLRSTEKGQRLIDVLPTPLTSAVTTAKWQEKMDAIVTKDITLDEFLKAQTVAVNKLLAMLQEKKEKELKVAPTTKKKT